MRSHYYVRPIFRFCQVLSQLIGYILADTVSVKHFDRRRDADSFPNSSTLVLSISNLLGCTSRTFRPSSTSRLARLTS